MATEGSAFVDHAGKVVAADDGFRIQLGIAGADAAGVVARAGEDGVLGALLAGEGPDAVRVAGPNGPVEVLRTRCDGGAFLRARPAPPGASALEHAMHSLALSRLAGGVAHDVKNPLNAMALQIALLTDKIGGAGEPLASACANNLASLRNQITRVNEVVRRLADVSDPAPATVFDVGALAADVGSLFAHEARRRRVAWSCEAAPGVVHGRGDPARVARLLLGIVWRALSQAEGGAGSLRAAYDGDEAVIALEHGRDGDAALAWVPEVTAEVLAEMGGRLVRERLGQAERLELRLRRESAT